MKIKYSSVHYCDFKPKYIVTKCRMLSLKWNYIISKMTLQVIFRGLVFGNIDPNEVIAFDDLSFSPGCVSTGGNIQPHTPNIIT